MSPASVKSYYRRREGNKGTAGKWQVKSCGCATQDGEVVIPCLRHNHLEA